MRKALVVLNLLFVAALFAHSVHRKELLLAEGRTVYLELAPVDPRALMTGDYMALNYALAAEIPVSQDAAPRDGFVVVTLDTRGVAAFSRLDQTAAASASDEASLLYRIRNGRASVSSNAYYFQEGRGDLFRNAVYGEVKVAPTGECLLVGLCDSGLARLQ